MLPIEFDNALKDWQEVEFGNLKTNYERTRMSIFYQLMSQSTKSISFNEFCRETLPFPWDEDKNGEVVAFTDDDYTFMQNLGNTNNKIKDLTLEETDELTRL
jgi:hypothetical protein